MSEDNFSRLTPSKELLSEVWDDDDFAGLTVSKEHMYEVWEQEDFLVRDHDDLLTLQGEHNVVGNQEDSSQQEIPYFPSPEKVVKASPMWGSAALAIYETHEVKEHQPATTEKRIHRYKKTQSNRLEKINKRTLKYYLGCQGVSCKSRDTKTDLIKKVIFHENNSKKMDKEP